VVDAFSRIIRLGEGVSSTGLLSEAAMTRTFEALRVCARKITRHQATRARLVATEACRKAENAGEFIAAVRRDLDLELEILSREAEARLAVSGCAALIDQSCDLAVVFDIGGGSTEIIWLDLGGSKEPNQWRRTLADRLDAYNNIAAWTSLPAGVVTLAERFGGEHVTPEVFEAMVEDVLSLIAPFEQEHRFADVVRNGRVHMVGTSGTVTTLAGIMLGLQRYDRKRVDGSWMTIGEIRRITDGLLAQTYSERVAEPCIGRDRADLVLAGCAILEALIRMWPVDRLRVADRGLREGILATLMADDGHFRGSD
jgi:exopolyphosphatase/guanosine-5'-triphosphate,3'-diphosphate pyrophosphatase